MNVDEPQFDCLAEFVIGKFWLNLNKPLFIFFFFFFPPFGRLAGCQGGYH